MPWQQLKVQVDPSAIEAIEQFLLDRGGLTITYQDAADQAVFQREPDSTPLWNSTLLSCLFDVHTPLQKVVKALNAHPAVVSEAQVNVEILEDQDWERSWMANYKAMQYGEKLWICPSWESAPDPEAINIKLDPGLAFGSGSHQTTALCLRWLASANIRGKQVMDYGCGSGVLAIAAALLGATHVCAVDHHDQAISATEENRNRNGISAEVLSACLPEDAPDQPVDILIANILAEPLLLLADKFSELVKPGGTIVLSGILPEQTDQLLLGYEPWFDLDSPAVEQDWVRLTGRRKT